MRRTTETLSGLQQTVQDLRDDILIVEEDFQLLVTENEEVKRQGGVGGLVASPNWGIQNPQNGACFHEHKTIHLSSKGLLSASGPMGALQAPGYQIDSWLVRVISKGRATTVQSFQGISTCIPTFCTTFFRYEDDGGGNTIWLCQWKPEKWPRRWEADGDRLGPTFLVHEIGTGTDPVTRTETEPVTKTLEVEEVVSFIEPTPTALESVSQAPQQVLNDQGVTNMVE